MNEPLTVLFLANFLMIGLLPKIFFRRDGRFNLMWWLTAMPFFLCSVALVLALFGLISPISQHQALRRILDLTAVLFSAGSISLLLLTLGTHRIPIALWHQENDAPRHIVTYGAYRLIRHPFYASFLLALVGVVLFLPHWITFYSLLHGLILLNLTAAREERRLLASEFGDEYREYASRTGRFVPRLGAATESTGANQSAS